MKKADESKKGRILQTQAKIALKKAVAKAIRRHQLAGVPAVIWKNGKVVRLPAGRSKSRPNN